MLSLLHCTYNHSTHPLLFFIKHVHTTPGLCLFHILTIPLILPESPQIRSLVVALIMLPHHLFNRLVSLRSVIKRDPGDVVMHNMASGSAVEEEISNEAEFSVHC
jgi:hypothetical protein